MKKEDIVKDLSNPNTIIVYTILIVTIAITGLFCFLVYYNKVLPKKIDVETFTKSNDELICKIINITNNGNYIEIEGKYLKDVKKYEIYVGVENNTGEIEFYKTQKEDENTFFANIKKSKINNNSSIKIAYMCDNEKILIDTNKIVGENNE